MSQNKEGGMEGERGTDEEIGERGKVKYEQMSGKQIEES